MLIALNDGYRGYVGIEYEGDKLSEIDGIRQTKKLLQEIRDYYAGSFHIHARIICTTVEY